MDYKKKYLKYKSKYLNLKKMIGSGNLKHIKGGKRSGLSRKILIEMVKNKLAVFYLDKADPDNFSLDSKSKFKPGYHIHAIFNKGDKFYIDGKEFEHEGSLNMKAFVKTIKDKQGKEWVVYDHDLDPELDIHLINSFPKN